MSGQSGVTPKNEDHMMLFVTGIPSKTTPEVVLQHFSRFGTVELFKLSNVKKFNKVLSSQPSTNTRRGFCVLQAKDSQTYTKVLNSIHIQFQGRSLAIIRFRQGPELSNHNEYINSRRVIIKKVPAGICQDSFKEKLQSAFGTITRMYRYEAESIEKAAKKEKRRKTNTYSVEFDEVASAEKASSKGLFYLQEVSVPVVVERYQRKALNGENYITNLKSGMQTRINANINSQVVTSKANTSQLVTSDKVKALVLSCAPSTKPAVYHHGSHDISMEHFVKPTARQYFTTRLQVPEDRSLSATSIEDVRFNTRQIKQPPATDGSANQTTLINVRRHVGNLSQYFLF